MWDSPLDAEELSDLLAANIYGESSSKMYTQHEPVISA
jgi:hypothetical protein